MILKHISKFFIPGEYVSLNIFLLYHKDFEITRA